MLTSRVIIPKGALVEQIETEDFIISLNKNIVSNADFFTKLITALQSAETKELECIVTISADYTIGSITNNIRLEFKYSSSDLSFTFEITPTLLSVPNSTRQYGLVSIYPSTDISNSETVFSDIRCEMPNQTELGFLYNILNGKTTTYQTNGSNYSLNLYLKLAFDYDETSSIAQLSYVIRRSDKSYEMMLPKNINFFRRDLDDKKYTGLISGTSELSWQANIGSSTSMKPFQYLVRYPSNSSSFNFLNVFFGLNNVANTSSDGLGLYTSNDSRVVNYSNDNVYVPRNKVLRRSELLLRYRVFYFDIGSSLKSSEIANREYSELFTEPTSLGAADVIPILFDEDGRKIPQSCVCMIRDTIGKKIFILTPKTSGTYSTNIGMPAQGFLQPKNLFSKSVNNSDLTITEVTSDSDEPAYDISNYYRFKVELNRKSEHYGYFADPELFSVALNGTIVDKSFYYMRVDMDFTDPNNSSTNETPKIYLSSGQKIPLVRRKGLYNNNVFAEESNTISSRYNNWSVASNGVQNDLQRDFYITLYLDKNILGMSDANVTLIPRGKFADYYTVSSFASAVGNVNKTHPLFDYYTFDRGTGYYKNIQYNANDTSANLEFIPKFNTRRTLIVDIQTDVDTDDTTGDVDFNIDKLEYQTQIVSQYMREDRLAEYDVFSAVTNDENVPALNSNNAIANNASFTFYGAEPNHSVYKSADSRFSLSSGGIYQISYQYGPYVRANSDTNANTVSYQKVKKTYDGNTGKTYNLLENELLTESFFNVSSGANNDLSSYRVSDPETITYIGSDSELLTDNTSAVFLYEKVYLNSQLDPSEPYVEENINDVTYRIHGYHDNSILANINSNYNAARNSNYFGLNDSTNSAFMNTLSNISNSLDILKGYIYDSENIVANNSMISSINKTNYTASNIGDFYAAIIRTDEQLYDLNINFNTGTSIVTEYMSCNGTAEIDSNGNTTGYKWAWVPQFSLLDQTYDGSVDFSIVSFGSVSNTSVNTKITANTMANIKSINFLY